jgi:RNA polymerase sigma-70 factor (ECF subfamily)
LPLLIVPEGEADDPPGADPFTDDQLRLIFTCCHPAIAPEARVALSLRLICGLETAAIARLFIVPVPTMAARITRAKKKIAAAGIAYRVPDRDELPARLPTVLSTIYLLFTAGHTAPSGESLTSPELSWRALDLARLVCTLMPGEPEVLGLFALIRLSDSRRATRTDERGRLILLADQDRSRWDRSAIAEGTAALERSLAMTRGPLPGAFALQGAIEAVHLEATSFDETDWRQLDALYGLLHDVAPSPLVRLNRAVVVAKLAGPEAALDELDRIRGWSGGSHYHLRAMTQAELLRQSGRMDEAAAEYSKALALPQNDAERAFIVERLAEIS